MSAGVRERSRGRARSAALFSVLACLIATPALAAVGRTAAMMSVSDNGSAEYRIPIVVPPGINGLTPNIALAYSSNARNGLLGVGWSLAGLSSVTRCAQTIAQHGTRKAVQVDSSDRFCLDGNVLRLVNAVPYGDNGSEYRTELETYARIRVSAAVAGSPTTFTVERKDGLKYFYGSADDTRIQPVGSSIIRTWLLSSIADRSGNAIGFSYYKDLSTGGYRPKAITWTDRSGTSGPYKIEFFYEGRPDTLTTYATGSVVQEPNRLSRIDVTYNTSSLTRRYWLIYQTAPTSASSRIAQIQECGVGGDCVPATNFQYAAGAAGYAASTSTQTNAVGGYLRPAAVGDFNGDGRSDVIYPSTVGAPGDLHIYYMLGNATGGFDGPYDSGLLCPNSNVGPLCTLATQQDSDGDGRMEIAGSVTGGVGIPIYELATVGQPFQQIGGLPEGLPMDYDGDGRDDRVNVQQACNSLAVGICVTPTMEPIASYTAPNGQFFMGASMFASNLGWINQTPVDFNGDGRSDIGVVTAANLNQIHTFRALLSRVGGFTEASASITFDPTSSANFSSGFVPLDVNGDGCTDVLHIISPAAKLYISNCGRAGVTEIFQPAVTTPIALAANTFVDTRMVLAVDWDGDGRQDIVYGGNVYRSTGTGLAAAAAANLPARSGSLADIPIQLGDFNGDGQVDLLYDVGSSIVWVPHAGATTPDLLTNATDAYGVSGTVTYGVTTNSAVHSLAPFSYPLRPDIVPRFVVSTIDRSVGDGNTWSEYHSYFWGALSLTGRGSLGFGAIRRNDGNTGLWTYEYLAQAYPYTGMRYQVDVISPTWVLVDRQQMNLNDLNYGSGYELRQFPYATTRSRIRYELDGALSGAQIASESETILAMDSTSGTPTSISSVMTEPAGSNGLSPGRTYSTATVIPSGYLVNDTTNWCLGRASRTEVTKSHSGSFAGEPRTRTTGATWDGLKCRPDQTVIEPADPTVSVTTNLYYDAFGNVETEQIIPAGLPPRSRTALYGTSGYYPLTVINEMSESTTQTFNPLFGAIATRTDANQLLTSFTYDSMGRSANDTRPDGTKTERFWTVCPVGQCDWRVRTYRTSNERATDNSLIGQTVEYFDMYDRPLYEYRWSPLLGSAAYSVRGYTYDAAGRVVQALFPFLNTATSWPAETTSFDALSRVRTKSRPVSASDPTIQSVTYTFAGRTTSVQDAEGKTTSQVTDVLGRIVRSTDGVGYAITTDYDCFGNPRRSIDSGG